MKLVSTSLLGPTSFNDVYKEISNQENDNSEEELFNDLTIPTLTGVARKIAWTEGTHMDDKQYTAYEVICCTFLLELIKDAGDPDSDIYSHLQDAISNKKNKDIEALIEELKIRGGHDHLIMFLTGAAGAGKSTATKIAWRFCFDFCRAVGTLWKDETFLFTAYTGAAAMAVGGLTICKAAYLLSKKHFTEEDRQMWRRVKILIIDEISFMCDRELNILNKRLQSLRHRNKPFGGFSVIFAGDFRQLEPNGAKNGDLIFSKQSSRLFENSVNVVMILDNEHRFQEDKDYGKLLKTMWDNDLPRKLRILLNTTRLVGNKLKLPKEFPKGHDVSYAAPYNKDRNAISAGNFRRHIIATHPPFKKNEPDGGNETPPKHTIVIKANMQSTRKSKRKIDNVLRHRIITTCGDSDVKHGHKHVDPALCLYSGAYLICTIGNECLREKIPRGNGTLCRLISVKLNQHASSRRYRNYYGRKVLTVKASNVEWIECEHVVKTDSMLQFEKQLHLLSLQLEATTNSKKKEQLQKQMISITEKLVLLSTTRRFKLHPKTNTVTVNVKPFHASKTKTKLRCRMTQLPVNLNDATTGHKLQGSSKDCIIITSWPKGGFFRNWEYTVLLRVRTMKGLYLLKLSDLEKSFKPTPELKSYLVRARRKQDAFLHKCISNMTQYYGTPP